MTSPKYDNVVYIGRFEPSHLAHIQIIKRALDQAERVIILVGSANQPRTIKNPWTFNEREQMLRAALPQVPAHRLVFCPVRDIVYNDQEWTSQVQSIIQKHCGHTKVAVIGHSKDESSYYLKMFPQWDLIEVENINDLNATDIRSAYFQKDKDPEKYAKMERNIPKEICSYLKAFTLTPEYDQLVDEFNVIQEYKNSWESSPYPPSFITGDAVVVQSGHILLVKRRSHPGKNLWALPGGFINQSETFEQGIIRELKEETRLKVPIPVIKGSIRARETFDAPGRSLRGRTITQAILIELEPGPLPKVKGSDDAVKAKWVELSVFQEMEDQLFEDHYHIVNKMLGKS